MILFVTNVMLFIISVIVIVLASLNENRDSSKNYTIAGVITLITSIIGTYGAYSKDRGGLQLAYVLLIWQLANGSQYFFEGLKSTSKTDSICSDVPAGVISEGPYKDCARQRRITTGQSTVAAILFVLCLFMSWLTSNFSEKIQDSIGTFQRERDIRFAIENQAMKLKVAKRWKKAYHKVVVGENKPPTFYGESAPPLAPGGGGGHVAALPPLSTVGHTDEPPRASGSSSVAASPAVPVKRKVPGAVQDSKEV